MKEVLFVICALIGVACIVFWHKKIGNATWYAVYVTVILAILYFDYFV